MKNKILKIMEEKGFFEFSVDVDKSFSKKVLKEFKNGKFDNIVISDNIGEHALRRKINNSKKEPFIISRGVNGYNKNFYDFWFADKVFDYIKKVKSCPKYNYILNSLLKDFEVKNTNLYISISDTNTRSMHRDLERPMRQIKIFTYLTDVRTNEMGPYTYTPKNSNKEIVFLGVAGTSVVSDQSGMHTGLPQSKGRQRLVLVTNLVRRSK